MARQGDVRYEDVRSHRDLPDSGPTETKFFERAGLVDTQIGVEEKDDPAKVAKDGWEAMMANEGGVVSGMKNKMQVAAAHIMPAETLARQHTKKTKPGTAEKVK